jgi:nucleoside-triphosphatase THEP1
VSELLDSPVSPLAIFYRDSRPLGELILLTGPSGAGKTKWCQRLAGEIRTAHRLLSGLVSPAVYDAGRKVAIDLLDLQTGRRRRLATHQGQGRSGLPVGRWRFDPASIAWGNNRLGHFRPGEYLILDELGPLEFKHGRGLQAAMTLIDERSYALACAVVRPKLLSSARQRWPWGQVVTLKPIELKEGAR